jgi:chorismate-pyruvate lyase
VTSTSTSEGSLLHPLDEFYRTAGRCLPFHRAVVGDQIPEPERSLLVHHRDMTSTLEQFHGRPIHLEVVSIEIRGNILHREVVLVLDETNEAVEFGATRVHLDRFPEPWRSDIVASRRPLGGILNGSGQPYTSRPSAFFALESDSFLEHALRLSGRATLYGRQNTLRTPEGLEIAEILEILPPGGRSGSGSRREVSSAPPSTPSP